MVKICFLVFQAVGCCCCIILIEVEITTCKAIFQLLDCLERNEQAGIVYHREGIMGDYDEFEDLEKLIDFIRTGKRRES